jgi:hypothetical protein
MYEVVIDGQPQKVSLEQMRRDYQRASAANKRFEEAQAARAEAQRLQAEHARRYEDPRVKALLAQNPGMEPEDAAAIIRIQGIVDREQMSPEQRKLLDDRQKLDAEKRQIEEQRQAQADARQKAETQAHIQRFNQEIPAAMEAAGLPRDPEIVRVAVGHMANMVRLGLPIDVKWAVQDAKNQMVEKYAPVFSRMPAEHLVQILGKPAIDAIQKHLIGQATQPPRPAIATPPAAAPKKPTYGMSPEQWRRTFGREG